MDTLVALQIMVAVEALRALVAAERSVGLRIGLRHVVAVKLLHGCMSAVVVHRHAVRHAVDKRKSTVGVANVGEDRAMDGWVGERCAWLVVCGVL